MAILSFIITQVVFHTDIKQHSGQDEQYSKLVVHQRQYARRGHIQTICEHNDLGNPATKSQDITPSQLSRIYVDDTYKMLYCEVPKVACTNWKRILLILSGKMNTSDPERLSPALVHTEYQRKYLRTLNTYKPHQILTKIRHYYKFMFVRNPLERVVSAYRNKFATSYNKRYPMRIGRKIIQRYRPGASQHSMQTGDDVTFEEFVMFLLDERTKQPYDIHWRPYYQICHPCMMQYDFVGKYETLNQDVDFILEELGVKHLIDFPERPNTFKTSDVLKAVFSNISSEQVHNLWKLYSVDYSMFGYPYPDL